eukprot:351971-Chlamydomonas_euryale.AAC.2
MQDFTAVRAQTRLDWRRQTQASRQTRRAAGLLAAGTQPAAGKWRPGRPCWPRRGRRPRLGGCRR